MKFIHLTDLHLTAPGEKLWGLDPHQRVQAALDDIMAHHADAERVIITGDLTERGERAAYAALKELRDRLTMARGSARFWWARMCATCFSAMPTAPSAGNGAVFRFRHFPV